MRRMTKNRYQQMLKTYTDRRAGIKKQFKRGDPLYAQRVQRIQMRITHCRKQIKLMSEKEDRLRDMAWTICEFMDISLLRGAQPLRNSVASTEKKTVMARALLYKHALENHMEGSLVSWWVGAGGRDTACRGRLAFTRSFQTKPENRGLWNHFKLYLNTSKAVDGGLKKAVAA